jgi:hypothetical protein
MSEVTVITFKGDGSFPTPEAGVNWQLGFDHGYDYAIKNYQLGKKFNPFPGDSNKGWFGNGFAEGVNSGRSFIIHRDYPNLKSIGYEGGKYGNDWCIVTFKNDNFIRIECEK